MSDIPCDPICDFCRFYNFNADEDGAYTGDGQCEHPSHPHPSDPISWCADFVCQFCGKTDADYYAVPLAPGEADQIVADMTNASSTERS